MTKVEKYSQLARIWELRWKARTDIVWLCNNVLDFTLISDELHGPLIRHLQQFPVPTPEQARASDLILDNGKFRYTPWCDPYVALQGTRRRMTLDSRGRHKTSLATIAHSIQWLLNFPHIAMGVFFATDGKAQDILKSGIKRHFQTNKKLRELFPEYGPQRRIMDWGTAEEFTLDCRDEVLQRMKLPPRVEPSVKSLALEKSMVGYHFDIIKCSDLVDNKNSMTPTARAIIMDDFGLMPNLLVRRMDAKDGWIDLEGTFYHPSDLHNEMIKDWRKLPPERRIWQIFIRGVFERDISDGACDKAQIPRRKVRLYDPNEMLLPFAIDKPSGKRISTWPIADPIEKLEIEEADLVNGGLRFACTPGWSKILMSDWSEKPIADVQIGDEIVGYHNPAENPGRKHLKPVKVLDKGSLVADIVEVELESGKKLYCTPDHRWQTDRCLDRTHFTEFMTPKIGRKFQRVYKQPVIDTDPEKIKTWAYLSGIIDGEGHIDTHKGGKKAAGSNVTITQSTGRNQPICTKIEQTLDLLDIKYNVFQRKTAGGLKDPNARMRIYWLKGARSLKIRMLANMDFAKAPQLKAHLWALKGKLTDGGGKGTRNSRGGDKVVAIRPAGQETVYWLQTETGNYVSQGYASKNSQRVLDMNADKSSAKPFQQGLSWKSREDYNHIPIAFKTITCDFADTTGPLSNPSVITTCGWDRIGRCYVENIQRGLWGPDETIKRVFDEYKRANHWATPVRVVSIEEYAYVRGLKPSIERKQALENTYLPLVFLKRGRGANEKIKRIVQTLVPPVNNGELWFLNPITVDPSQDAVIRNAVENEFRECTAFSTGTTDDILDTLTDQYLIRQNPGLNAEAAHDPAIAEHMQKQQLAEAWKNMLYPVAQEATERSPTGW